MASHSSILAVRTPWTEKGSGLRSRGHKELDTTDGPTPGPEPGRAWGRAAAGSSSADASGGAYSQGYEGLNEIKGLGTER